MAQLKVGDQEKFGQTPKEVAEPSVWLHLDYCSKLCFFCDLFYSCISSKDYFFLATASKLLYEVSSELPTSMATKSL